MVPFGREAHGGEEATVSKSNDVPRSGQTVPMPECKPPVDWTEEPPTEPGEYWGRLKARNDVTFARTGDPGPPEALHVWSTRARPGAPPELRYTGFDFAATGPLEDVALWWPAPIQPPPVP